MFKFLCRVPDRDQLCFGVFLIPAEIADTSGLFLCFLFQSPDQALPGVGIRLFLGGGKAQGTDLFIQFIQFFQGGITLLAEPQAALFECLLFRLFRIDPFFQPVQFIMAAEQVLTASVSAARDRTADGKEIAFQCNGVDFVTECQYLGVNALGNSAIEYRLFAKSEKGKRADAKRNILHKTLEVLEQHKVNVPYPQMDIHRKD